jgi:hypothetical protein
MNGQSRYWNYKNQYRQKSKYGKSRFFSHDELMTRVLSEDTKTLSADLEL